MATKCKNAYEVRRRIDAFRRLQVMKGGPSYEIGLPPPEIFGIKPKRKGLFTFEDILTEINKKNKNMEYMDALVEFMKKERQPNPRCPHCKSLNVTYSERDAWGCAECGTIWLEYFADGTAFMIFSKQIKQKK
jgi:ribosomal protein L37AE/L43A